MFILDTIANESLTMEWFSRHNILLDYLRVVHLSKLNRRSCVKKTDFCLNLLE